MSPAQADIWRYRIQNLFGMGILERLARPKLLWFYIYAEPLPDAPDYKSIIGGFVDVWVFHSDSAVAEQIARKVIADKKWQCGKLGSPKVVTRWTYKRRSKTFPNYVQRSLAHFDEAIRVGFSAQFHGVPREGDY